MDRISAIEAGGQRSAETPPPAPHTMLSSRQTLDRCGFCSCTKQKLTPCTSCGTVAYCSQEHERFDWKRHKPLCKTVQSLRGASSGASASPSPVPVVASSSNFVDYSLPPSTFSGSSQQKTAEVPPPTQSTATFSSMIGSSILTSSPLTTTSLTTSSSASEMLVQAAAAAQAQVLEQQLLTQCPSFAAFAGGPGPSTSSVVNPIMVPTQTIPSSRAFRTYYRPDNTKCAPAVPDKDVLFPSVEKSLESSDVAAPSILNGDKEIALEARTRSPKRTQETEPRLIETDDPDIQIIEPVPGSSSSTTTSRSRKRLAFCHPSSSKAFKDHTANESYSVSPDEHRSYLMEQGRMLNLHQAGELRLTFIAEHIHSSITEYGWAVVDNFLGMDHCETLHKEMQLLESRGLFSAGQLVEAKNKDEQHIKDIRSDKTYWFNGTDEKSSDASTIRLLTTCLDGIVVRFSRHLKSHNIQGRSKAMLAVYPGNGSRYVKHVDNPAKDGRRITVIYYCNPGWDYKVDGGVLRLYPETSSHPLDIEPKADRLLLFWSDNRIPHEVMPVYKNRYAITVWYMDREERGSHIKKADPRRVQEKQKTPEAVRQPRRNGGKDDMLDSPKSPKESRLDSYCSGAPVELPPHPPVAAKIDPQETDSGVASSLQEEAAVVRKFNQFREQPDQEKEDVSSTSSGAHTERERFPSPTPEDMVAGHSPEYTI